MENNSIKLKIKAYDSKQLDQSIVKIIQTVKATGAEVKGPIPLPTRRSIITVLRATHKYKDSREQFEQRTHKRLLQILNANSRTQDQLTRIKLPSGVSVDIEIGE